MPPPGNLPDPGIEPASPISPALAGRFFTTSATWEPNRLYTVILCETTEDVASPFGSFLT